MLAETSQETFICIDGYSHVENDCEAPLEQGEMNRYYTYTEIPAPVLSPKENSRCPNPVEFLADAISGLFDTAKHFLKGDKKEKGGN